MSSPQARARCLSEKCCCAAQKEIAAWCSSAHLFLIGVQVIMPPARALHVLDGACRLCVRAATGASLAAVALLFMAPLIVDGLLRDVYGRAESE